MAKKKDVPMTDGEPDGDAPYRDGGHVKKKKREIKVRGEKSRARLDKKKR